MKASEMSFLVRCANLKCEELISSYTPTRSLKKEFVCPRCGEVNVLFFLKAVYKVKKKNQDQKIRCVNYS